MVVVFVEWVKTVVGEDWVLVVEDGLRRQYELLREANRALTF